MEAFWTRFNPIYEDVYKLCFEESVIGDIVTITSQLSFLFEQSDPSMDRIYNPALGGGVLLDIGIYALSWPVGLLNHNRKLEFPEISSQATLSNTGVDVNTAVVLKYGKDKIGIANCSAFYENQNNHVVIYGTRGRIEVDLAYKPTRYWLYDGAGKLIKEKKIDQYGNGMYFEADHVGECLAKGLIESDWYTLEDTLTMAKILETVRKQNNIVYPDNIESTEMW
ncbi:unnamed protein product [Ambrosiozyma monospora]|uniref:Unnamed protein product n=1 Tax=Ambrosiozyma monospora TaxID=43982 RepID=A0ACB5T6Q5_AMBMO|nr:unnamed protein product [Ambrosiozyma monospora]